MICFVVVVVVRIVVDVMSDRQHELLEILKLSTNKESRRRSLKFTIEQKDLDLEGSTGVAFSDVGILYSKELWNHRCLILPKCM